MKWEREFSAEPPLGKPTYLKYKTIRHKSDLSPRIQPLSNNVLIRRHPPQSLIECPICEQPRAAKDGQIFCCGLSHRQSSRIITPDGIAASNRGTVLAVGPGKLGKKGGRIPVDVKVGDTVLFYELAEIHEPSGMTQNPFNRVSEDAVMINEKYIQMVLG